MEIAFCDEGLARVCCNDLERERVHGPELGKVIRRRLGQLDAVDHLAAMRTVPAAQMRSAVSPCDGTILLALGPTADLVVRPRDDPAPTCPDGSLDEYAVTAVLVTAIVATGTDSGQHTPSPPCVRRENFR